MATPQFDKEGNLTNLDELSNVEVAAAYSEKNKGLFGRLTEEERLRKEAEAKAAKAEQDLEAAKKAPPQPKEENNNPPPPASSLSEEELRLIARGLSDEEIAEAKAISAGKKITLTEALKDNTFLLFQQDFREKKRKEDAKLGASHGSGQGAGEESEFKPGMSQDEHRAAFDKARGKLT